MEGLYFITILQLLLFIALCLAIAYLYFYTISPLVDKINKLIDKVDPIATDLSAAEDYVRKRIVTNK
jgi:hypothetical protein